MLLTACVCVLQIAATVDHPAASPGPVFVESGLFDPALAGSRREGRWLEVLGPQGTVGFGFATAMGDHAVLRLVLPGPQPAGRRLVRIAPRARPVASDLTVTSGDHRVGVLGSCMNLRTGPGPAFEVNGATVSVQGSVQEGTPWVVGARDPLRVGLLREFTLGNARGPGVPARLWVEVFGDVERVRVTLVVAPQRDVTFDTSVVVAVGPAGGGDVDEDIDGAEPGPVAGETGVRLNPVPEPTFESFMAELACPSAQRVDDGRTIATFVPLRPTVGARGIGLTADGGVLVAAILPGETLSAGELRVLRLEVGRDAAAAMGAWLLPVSAPRRSPGVGGASAALAAPARPDGPTRQALERAIVAYRTEPSAGALWRFGDAGDWSFDGVRAGNLKFDTAFGWTQRLFETRAPMDAWSAIAGVEHLVTRDRDTLGSGLFLPASYGHREAPAEAGQSWVEGLVAVAGWRDEPWLNHELGCAASDQERWFARSAPTTRLSRDLGWGLLALATLRGAPHRDACDARVLRRRFAEALALQAPSGHLLIEPAERLAGGFRSSPFVDVGIVAPALLRAGTVLRDPRGREAARRLAEAVMRDGILRRGGESELRSSLLLRADTGQCVAALGSASGEETALFVAGLVEIGIAPDPKLCAGIAGRLTLGRHPTLGRELSILLRALPKLPAGC